MPPSSKGAVSITPVHLDLTHYPSFPILERLGLEWP
jgi:hypothetical protein